MGLLSRSCPLLLLLLLLIPAALTASTCANTNPCLLSCDGCDVDELIPDPLDCRRYYRCQGSAIGDYYPEAFDCGSGEVFDDTTHQCVAGSECMYDCPEPSLSCDYECPSIGTTFIPVSSDCGSYYLCSGGAISASLSCDASKPYFDGTKCQTDVSRCCHCHPYCTAVEAMNTDHVADPQDCRRYFVCFAQGNPVDYVTCPSGQYFDASTRECSDKLSCNLDRTCTNVVDMDGCIDPYTCLTSGYSAKCPDDCTADYYHCLEPTGDFQEPESCSGGKVFHPSSHTCVDPSQCP